MNIIVDCNQASALPTDRSVTRKYGLGLSPSVLAEILMRTDPGPTLKRIQSYYFRVGLESADVILELSRLSPREILGFEPFYSARRSYSEDYEGLLEAVFKPTDAHREWAKQKKLHHLESCCALLTQTPAARAEIKQVRQEYYHKSGAKSIETKLSDYRPMLEKVFEPDSFPADMLKNALVARGTTLERAAENCSAAMQNPYVRRLFRSLHAYCLGAAGTFQAQTLNVIPAASRDDLTDMLLPLYAADGDIIVTADKGLARLIELIEPEKVVTVRNASELH